MLKNNMNKSMVMSVAALLAIAFVFRMIYENLQNAMLQAVMLTVGCLMLFWLIDKIVKWDFTGSVTHPMVRYLWYGFYVGILFIPTLGAFFYSSVTAKYLLAALLAL